MELSHLTTVVSEDPWVVTINESTNMTQKIMSEEISFVQPIHVFLASKYVR